MLVDEYSDEIWNKTYLINQTNNGTVYKGDNKISDGGKYFGGYNEKTHKYSYNFDLIYKDFDSELNTYKHTFKKADNGNYYWYSSEIVNK